MTWDKAQAAWDNPPAGDRHSCSDNHFDPLGFTLPWRPSPRGYDRMRFLGNRCRCLPSMRSNAKRAVALTVQGCDERLVEGAQESANSNCARTADSDEEHYRPRFQRSSNQTDSRQFRRVAASWARPVYVPTTRHFGRSNPLTENLSLLVPDHCADQILDVVRRWVGAQGESGEKRGIQ
jgi:hypothetical protein